MTFLYEALYEAGMSPAGNWYELVSSHDIRQLVVN